MTRLPLALRLSASTPTRETLPAVFVSAVYALVLYAAHRVGWLPDSTAWAAAKLSGSVSMGEWARWVRGGRKAQGRRFLEG